ncbi:MAG TPA: hypothetical protein PKO06_12075, partial [Candidatus Ozemobacteraceae bacterium]|nr:hypothetical protein [Candidatus Ozemobacteraceae bacterium]
VVGSLDGEVRLWKLRDDEQVDWVLGVVDRPVAQVEEIRKTIPHAYVLIVNTPTECVIGEQRQAVDELVRRLGCSYFGIEGVSSVHNEAATPVAQAYRALHLFETNPPDDIAFYSSGWARRFAPSREEAADSILAQAVGTIDYPKVIEQAYADGARLFVEVGPKASCSRMIGRILGDRPFMARSASLPGQGEASSILRLVAHLQAEGVVVDPTILYQTPEAEAQSFTTNTDSGNRRIVVTIGCEPDWTQLSRPGTRPLAATVPVSPSPVRSSEPLATRPAVNSTPKATSVPLPAQSPLPSAQPASRVVGENSRPTPEAATQENPPAAPLRPAEIASTIRPTVQTPVNTLISSAQPILSESSGTPQVERPGQPRPCDSGSIAFAQKLTTRGEVSAGAAPACPITSPVLQQMVQVQSQTAAAHAAYLRTAEILRQAHLALLQGGALPPASGVEPLAVQGSMMARVVQAVPSSPATVLESLGPQMATEAEKQSKQPVQTISPGLPSSAVAQTEGPEKPVARVATSAKLQKPVRHDACEQTVFLDRLGSVEFGIGRIGAALGDFFAPIDQHPTRVRLPGDPLNFCDRIVLVEGEKGSLKSGRVVTEHDVIPEGWYLDGGCMPTGLSVEAGQADLFMSSWLGIDFKTKGLAMYRLLDAVVTIHGPLPRPGQTIRYDIKVDRFIRQADTYLFFFQFDGTIDGKHLITMREGCAGFFTQKQLDEGKGIVLTDDDLRVETRPRPPVIPGLPAPAITSLDDQALAALRVGDLETAFGPEFAGLPLRKPLTIPSGKLAMIDRVTSIEPNGGRFGLGLIKAEIDIDPDAWFLTCHFTDDMVMPGTLMYESCLQALRVFLLRLGWVAETGECFYEPVPEVKSRLRCRGQVIRGVKRALYELTIKQIGYGPEPYAIADALMFADGRMIVQVTDMSIKLTGSSPELLRTIWAARKPTRHPQTLLPELAHAAHLASVMVYDRRDPIITYEQVEQFSIGKPSLCFG